MKLTANDLKEAGVCDRVIPEPPGGVKREHERFFTGLRRLLTLEVDLLCKQNINTLLSERYDRYRALGAKGRKYEISLHWQFCAAPPHDEPGF